MAVEDGTRSREHEKEEHPVAIEFAGTPYPYRNQGILDGNLKTDFENAVGIQPRWKPVLDLDQHSTIGDFNVQFPEFISHFQRSRDDGKPVLYSQGPFQMMVFMEYFAEIGQASRTDTRAFQEFMFGYARQIDRVIVTKITPRAAIASMYFIPDETGERDFHNERYVFYTIFNRCLDSVVNSYGSRLPGLRVIDIPGDSFDYGALKIENAAAMYEALEIPLRVGIEREEAKRIMNERYWNRKKQLPLFTWAGLRSEDLF